MKQKSGSDDVPRGRLQNLSSPEHFGDQSSGALLLSVGEVCVLLHRSKARVYEMVRLNDIGHLHDGRSVLIPRDAVDEWIKRKQRQAGWKP